MGKKIIIPAILIFFFLIAFVRGSLFVDPDLGWHLREGQLILQKGIQQTDPFSYTMPSYAFIDHEWLQNILMHSIFTKTGTFGLTAFYALIFTAVLFIVSWKSIGNYIVAPLLLLGSVMLGFSGIRTQEVSWLFLAVILKIVFDRSLWDRFKYFVPILFIPWVNLHGGFAVGIAILFLIFILNFYKNKKIPYDYLKIFLLSLFATFFNPYGISIWHEVWMQITDSSLHIYVAEWYPLFFNSHITIYVLLSLSLVPLFIYRNKINFITAGVYMFLLMMAISSMRHVPLWAIAACVVVADGFILLNKQLKKNRLSNSRFLKIKKILIIFLLQIVLIEILSTLIASDNRSYYPVGAVSFLQKQDIKGNIFTTYNLGGYLIWKLPEYREFIDGRMASWRRGGEFTTESNYAFSDYLKMLSNDNFFAQQLKKYNITYLLFPTPQKTDQKYASESFDNLVRKLIYKNIDYHVLSEDLTKKGMAKVYEDSYYVVYENKSLKVD